MAITSTYAGTHRLYVHAPNEKKKLGATQLKCDANASFHM